MRGVPAQAESFFHGAQRPRRWRHHPHGSAPDVRDDIAWPQPGPRRRRFGAHPCHRRLAFDRTHHHPGIASAGSNFDHFGRARRPRWLWLVGLGFVPRPVHLQVRLPQRPQHFVEQAVEGRLVGRGQGKRLVLRAQGLPVESGQRLVEVLVADRGPRRSKDRLADLQAHLAWPHGRWSRSRTRRKRREGRRIRGPGRIGRRGRGRPPRQRCLPRAGERKHSHHQYRAHSE